MNDIFRKEVFPDVIKDLEMRNPPWFTRVGPESNDKCLYDPDEKTEEVAT